LLCLLAFNTASPCQDRSTRLYLDLESLQKYKTPYTLSEPITNYITGY
jgi:hypothetical protein